MSSKEKSTSTQQDLFALASASIYELLADLESEATLADDGGGWEAPRAEQIGGLILAEAVRLIRMGSREEIARASNALSQFLIRRAGKELERRHAESFRLVSGASVTLSAATPASSKGGARVILRSWSGRGQKAIEILRCARKQRLYRSELGTKLGIGSESHLSHLLSDLEAARLIVRIREGREVIVRLGPGAETDEVREALDIRDTPIYKLDEQEFDPRGEIVVASNDLGFDRQVLGGHPPFETTLPATVENEAHTTSLMVTFGSLGEDDDLKLAADSPYGLRQSRHALSS